MARQEVAKRFGLPNAVDSGSGPTVTNFDTAFDPSAQPLWTTKGKKTFQQQMNATAPPDADEPGLFWQNRFNLRARRLERERTRFRKRSPMSC